MSKLYKFLGIFFYCHRRADRSFFYKGKQFPICARCTGELVGMILGIILAIFAVEISFKLVLILLVPMLIDGGIQYIFKIESNNIRRLISGILFGVGFIYFFIHFHRFHVEMVKKYVLPHLILNK